MFLTKEQVHQQRAGFFDALIEEWTRPVEHIDALMGHAESFFPLDSAEVGLRINDVQHGLLVASATPPDSWGDMPRIIYSIVHAGDWLKFGFLVKGSAEALAIFNRSQDELMGVEKLWDRTPDIQAREGGGLLVEWRFVEPDFYENFAIQERFIQISRHVHMRICKALFDSRGLTL